MIGESTRNLILVVDDEREVASLVCRTLKNYGYRAEAVATGRDALHRLKTVSPALCIIDLGLPDMDGLKLVRDIQDRTGAAVIILTGRGETSDRVVGLEFGADDYIVKPFEPRELVARVRSVLRRIERIDQQLAEAAMPAEPPRAACFAGWRFDPASQALTTPDQRTVTLSVSEAQLLTVFVKAPNRILSRDHLLDLKDQGDLTPFDRSIDVRISRLRRKLEDDPQHPRLIKTIYGAGYLFAAEVHWSG